MKFITYFQILCCMVGGGSAAMRGNYEAALIWILVLLGQGCYDVMRQRIENAQQHIKFLQDCLKFER